MITTRPPCTCSDDQLYWVGCDCAATPHHYEPHEDDEEPEDGD